MKRILNYSSTKRSIQVLEVGLRDGLQNETKVLTLDQKRKYFDFMYKAGLRDIEIGSFVSPKWVPQMQGTKELIKNVEPLRSDMFLSVLVPNMKGCQEAVESKPDEIVLFVSTTDAFNKKNINCNRDEAFIKFQPVVELAKKNRIKIRGSMSCSFVCPYEGRVDPQKVVDTAMMYKDLGVDMIDVADTIGAAGPSDTDIVFKQLLQKVGTPGLFSAHFHDTNGKALDNIKVAMEHGISVFHSSMGGIGGCPYSSKRVGNLDTIKLVEWCLEHDIYTGLDLSILKQGQNWIRNELKQ